MFFLGCLVFCCLSLVLRLCHCVRLEDMVAWSWLGSRATVVWRKDKDFRRHMTANVASLVLFFAALYLFLQVPEGAWVEGVLMVSLILSTAFFILISFKMPTSPEAQKAMNRMSAWSEKPERSARLERD